MWCQGLVPQAGIEPASPALEGGFSTTGPVGSPEGVYSGLPKQVKYKLSLL